MSALRKSSITLYSTDDVESHIVRVVLAEKQIATEMVMTKPGMLSEDFLELNPYGNLPTLVDHGLVLNDTSIIIEYLDERFPHPPLFPVYPVERAQVRMAIRRIRLDYFSLYHQAQALQGDARQAKLNDLAVELNKIAKLFIKLPYCLSAEYSMSDCVLQPLLWRLIGDGMVLEQPIMDYAKRVFDRNAFKLSLTNEEFEMGELA